MAQRSSKSNGGLIGLMGALAFLAGFIICIVGGWARDNGGMTLTLVILGIIVGLFNITSREIVPFLIAAVALVVVGVSASVLSGPFTPLDDVIDGLGRVLNSFVSYLAAFMIPAAIINAIRAVWALARPGD